MKSNKGILPIEVFAGTIWQAGMVKSMLENAAIQAYLKDEIIGTLNPWWTDAGGAGPVKVMVSNLDFETAKAIVEAYEKNMKEENTAPAND